MVFSNFFKEYISIDILSISRSIFLFFYICMSREGENLKSIIPYSKEISFGSKIAEITSMSLEHELHIEPGCASGNFIISGDYKSHEVSVNREPFLYKLPFSIELTEAIDLDSLRFEIRDFSYDIVNDETIEVDIEFSLEAEEMAVDDPVSLDESEEKERGTLEKMEDPVTTTDITNLIDENLTFANDSLFEEEKVPEERKEVEEIVEERNEEEKEMVESRDDVIITNEKKEEMKESEETIIQNVNPMDDSYATYHIHVVNNGETVETICTMYHSNLNVLSEYNDMSNISAGDKIIIPREDE